MLLETIAFIESHVWSCSFSDMTHQTHASNRLSVTLATPFILSRRVDFKHSAVHYQAFPDRIVNSFPFRNFFISLPPGIVLLLEILMNAEGTIERTPWLVTPLPNWLYWNWIRPCWLVLGIHRVEKPHFLKLRERSA